MTVTERKRTMLARRLAELNEEWEAVYAQIGRELNEAAKLRLQRQANGIEQEIAGLETQLRQLGVTDEVGPVANASPSGGQVSTTQYNITITGGQGFVIGDQPTVTQHFADAGKVSDAEHLVNKDSDSVD